MKDTVLQIRISKNKKLLFLEAAKGMNKTYTEILDKKINYIIKKKQLKTV